MNTSSLVGFLGMFANFSGEEQIEVELCGWAASMFQL